jgi:regulatory protein
MRANDKNRETAITIDAALLEEWALSYLGRYASSADNLRRVLRRRVRRRFDTGERPDAAVAEADGLIDALILRYRAAALLDDAAYAAARARRDLVRGRSLRQIAAGLAAKGIARDEAAVAVAGLSQGIGDPDLAAACTFARRRRLGPYRTTRAEGDRQRDLAAFARAGFDRQAAEAVLACANEAEVADLLAGSAR